jgi:hypothetical protein
MIDKSAYELALVLRQILFMDAVDDFRDVAYIDGQPGHVIYYHRYKFAERPATLRPPFMPGLPEDVKLEACSVMNCMYGLATTSPSMAWIAERRFTSIIISGALLTVHRPQGQVRELDIVPNPRNNFSFWRMDADIPDSPSLLHTVMVISPDPPEDTQKDTGWAEGPQLGYIYHEDGHVSDPTYRQYAYESNGDKTSDYL